MTPQEVSIKFLHFKLYQKIHDFIINSLSTFKQTNKGPAAKLETITVVLLILIGLLHCCCS